MVTEEQGQDAPAAAFRGELAERTRRTGLAGGVVAFVAVLGWSGFDQVLEPAQAYAFREIRLLICLVIVSTWAALASGRARGRSAEIATLLMVSAIQIGIAWMLPRVENALPAYLLGFTLCLYGSALFIEWRRRYMIAVTVVSWAALGVAGATAPHGMTGADLAISAFNIGTASVIALVGQHLRHRTSWREYRARTDAERARAEAEQARSDAERERERNLELIAQLEELSRHDGLTGIANRRVFDETLERELARAVRDGSAVGLIMLDLDHFKRLNDSHGHLAGDQALCAVAEALARQIRAGDLAARYGGEEFAVILPGVTSTEIVAVAEGLRRRIAGLPVPVSASDLPTGITVSAGAATFPEHAASAADLIRAADRALYTAKAAGRDQSRLAG